MAQSFEIWLYVHRYNRSFNFDLLWRDIVAFPLHSQATAHHSLNCSRACFQAPTSYKKQLRPGWQNNDFLPDLDLRQADAFYRRCSEALLLLLFCAPEAPYPALLAIFTHKDKPLWPSYTSSNCGTTWFILTLLSGHVSGKKEWKSILHSSRLSFFFFLSHYHGARMHAAPSHRLLLHCTEWCQ